MLVVATADEGHMPVNSISSGIKAIIEGGALSSGIEDTNDDTNNADIDEVAAAGGPKRGVDIWQVLIVVIADGESIKVTTFIIVPSIGIGPVFSSIIGAA